MELSSEYYKSLQKADLHVHLNGAIPTATIRSILQKQEVGLPAGFSVENDLQILTPVSNLREYFKPWIAFKKIPFGKKYLEIMVSAAVSAMAMDNVKYVEFRNSPFYLCKLNSITLKTALTWLTDCLRVSGELYGVDTRLIVSLTRHELDLDKSWELLKVIEEINNDNIIVGVDLSGDEDYPIAKSDVASFFRAAKESQNFGVTIHAGETGNTENIIWAIEECQADRIGHGLAARNSIEVIKLLKEKNICVEVSLTSNLRTGYCKKLQDHSVVKFIEYDIPFVLCSDNPGVHNGTLSEEYRLFVKEFNCSQIIEQMFDVQNKYAFRKEAK